MFLDQRGTGLSSTVTAGTLARQGNAIKQAEYIKNFRADNIVRDCEAVRRCLTADYPEEKRKWSVIGQSFGGFCAVTYLSMLYVLHQVIYYGVFVLTLFPLTLKSPDALAEAFLCGGLPPLVNGPDPVYALTYGMRTSAVDRLLLHITDLTKRRLNRETKPIMPSIPKMPLE